MRWCEFTGGTWKEALYSCDGALTTSGRCSRAAHSLRGPRSALSGHHRCKRRRRGLYFGEKSHANAFVDFIGQSVPQKIRSSKKLVGFDTRSNLARHRYTILCDIAPTCKHDLILLPKHRAQNLESPLLIVRRVSSGVKLVFSQRPRDGSIGRNLLAETATHNPECWRIGRVRNLDIELLTVQKRDRRPIPSRAMVARASDLGTNDESFPCGPTCGCCRPGTRPSALI